MAEFMSGEIIYRAFSPERGIYEKVVPFASLQDLFTIVEEEQAPQLIDRIFVTGKDGEGRVQTIQLSLQNIKYVPNA